MVSFDLVVLVVVVGTQSSATMKALSKLLYYLPPLSLLVRGSMMQQERRKVPKFHYIWLTAISTILRMEQKFCLSIKQKNLV
jgi:hypothetical protein